MEVHRWRSAVWALLALGFLLSQASSVDLEKKFKVCIVGSGIGGASAAHFLRNYSGLTQEELEIDIYEKNRVVGGRMAMVNLMGDRFEAGASIIHPKNLHAVRFVELLGLKKKTNFGSDTFGLWNGNEFVCKTIDGGKSVIGQTIASWINSLSFLWRYGTSLFKMQSSVQKLLERFLHFYDEDRKPYSSVEDLLNSVELYAYTQHTLAAELLREGLSPRLITELVTAITRINYGQNVTLSGLAGSVALCGSGDNLWAVQGGNWQLADGLIKLSNASLRLNNSVVSISYKDDMYEVTSLTGMVKKYDGVVIATPLDEANILLNPAINLPKRLMHHTFVTFVRGLVNPDYFGVKSGSLPALIATMEVPDLPFISISVLKEYNETDKAYKIFSRAPLSDSYLDKLFSVRRKTIRYNWAAYPEYDAPEVFAPIILDGKDLYYANSFENAASAMETSAVAADNVARLLLSRLLKISKPSSSISLITESASEEL